MKYLLILVLFLSGCASVKQNQYTDQVLETVSGSVSKVHQDKNVVSYYERRDFEIFYVVQYVNSDGEIVLLTEDPRFFVDVAEACQLADLTTTVIGITYFGLVEGNPVGILILPGKYFSNVYAESLPKEQCIQAKRFSSFFGCGAAGMNIATMTTGELGLMSFGVGAATGGVMYKATDVYPGCEAWFGDLVETNLKTKFKELFNIGDF